MICRYCKKEIEVDYSLTRQPNVHKNCYDEQLRKAFNKPVDKISNKDYK